MVSILWSLYVILGPFTHNNWCDWDRDAKIDFLWRPFTHRENTRSTARTSNCACVNLDDVCALGILGLNKSIFDSQYHSHTHSARLTIEIILTNHNTYCELDRDAKKKKKKKKKKSYFFLKV